MVDDALTDPAPMDATPPSTSLGSKTGFLGRFVIAGLLGGLFASVLSLMLAAPIAGPHWIYGLSVGVLATAIAVVGVGLVAAIASQVAVHRGRALGSAIGMAPFIAGFLYVNATLFDGAWVKSRPWATPAEWAFKIGGTFCLLLVPFLLTRLSAQKLVLRQLTAISLFAAAFVFARLDQEHLAAYWQLKIQFAVLVVVLPAIAVWLLLINRRIGTGLALAAIVIAVTGSLVGGNYIRSNHVAIERARSIILTRPAPMLVRALGPIEEFIFDRLRPLDAEPIRSTNAVLDATYDSKALEAALNSAAPKRADMNVLMIAIDAMRADHMSCEGYARPTTPHLDKFARTASWFRRAVAPVPASSMGYSSAMSGLFARVTPAYAKEFGVTIPVPDGYMLAEVMRDSGRETMGVTAFHPAVQNVEKFKILERGFKTFNPVKSPDEKPGSAVVDSALQMLGTSAQGRAPWFLWMHVMEPHAPYHFHVGRDFGRRPIDAYDAEIAEADAQVARVFEWLEKSGQADKTIVVLFGDHGEGFGEHNNREHGASLYDHQVRVPMLIRVPGLAPKEIREWVTLADLTPTILGALGVDTKTPRTGRNLLPLMAGIPTEWPDWAYSERAAPANLAPRSWERAVWRGDKKLIWLPHNRIFQHFDLSKDPGELNNLWDPVNPTCQELLGVMRAADARIDSTWGGTGSRPSDVEETIDVRFGKLANEALGSDRKVSDAALASILDILNSFAIRLDSARQDMLGRPALDRLLVGLRQELPSLKGGDARRFVMTRILLYANRSEDVALMAQERTKTLNGEWRLQIARWLALNGNATGKDDLAAALKVASIESRITAAIGLGALGDSSGLALLRAALAINESARLREVVMGLAAIHDAEVLRVQNSSMRPVFINERVQSGLLLAALNAPKSLDATASLANLSRSTDRRVAKEAEEELLRRLTPAQLARRTAATDSIEGARSALLYGDAELSARFFRELTPDDDALIGSGWWLGVRTARMLNDAGLLEKCSSRLKVVLQSTGVLESDLSGTERLCPEIPRTLKVLAAEPTGEFAVPVLQRGLLFTTTMKLTNVSSLRLGGGESPDAFMLEWRYLQGDAKPVPGKSLIQVALPIGGLEPGASCTLIVTGMFPDKAGDWTPVLVATRDWAGRRDDVIFTAPKVTLK